MAAETKRVVRVVLGDLELEQKEEALERAVANELDAESKLSAEKEKFDEAKEKYEAAKNLAKLTAGLSVTLMHEVYSGTARRPVECEWRYHETDGLSYLHRKDNGAEVEGEPPRPATATEKTLSLDLGPAAPPAETVQLVPSAKEKVLAFMRAGAGGFLLDDIQQHTKVNKNTLKRVLPELCRAGVLSRHDADGTYWVVEAEQKAAE